MPPVALLTILTVVAAPAALGTLAAVASRLIVSRVATVAVGCIFGLALHVSLTFALTMLAPLTAVTPFIALILFAAIVLPLTIATAPQRQALVLAWRALDKDRYGLVLALLAATALTPVALQSVIETGNTGDGSGGLATGLLSAYGDMPFHVALATSLAQSTTFPPDNPIFSGQPLSYPFLSDFFVANLLRGGVGLASAFNLSAALLLTLTTILLFAATRVVTGSARASAWATALFVFGGSSLGWLQAFDFLPDVLTNGFASWPNIDVAGSGTNAGGFHFINPCFALLLAQRSLLFGLPLVLSIMLVQARWLKDPASTPRGAGIATGLLAGLLPLMHAHSLLALLPVQALMFAATVRRDRSALDFWLPCGVTTAVVGGLGMLYYHHVGLAGGQLAWSAWWQAGDRSPLVYWWLNTGLLVPAALAGLFLPLPRTAKLFALVGGLLFAFGNTVQVARWIWDNYKIFVYWLIFSLPLIGAVVAYCTERRRGLPIMILVTIVAALHGASGAVDYLKQVLPTRTSLDEWDREAVAFAAQAASVLPAEARLVTATLHNAVGPLIGRSSYLGYPAHVWSHGYEPAMREQAVRDFFQGRITRLPDITVTHAVVGPAEQRTYAPLVVGSDWREMLRLGSYALYQLPASTTSMTPSSAP